MITKKGSTREEVSSTYEFEIPTFDKNISCVVLYFPTFISLLTTDVILIANYSLYLL